MQRQAVILLSLMVLASCGGGGDNPVAPDEHPACLDAYGDRVQGGDSDNPVALDEHLVGTWAFDSTDMVDVMVMGARSYLRDLGADQDDIDALIAELRAESGNFLSGHRSTIRFNTDGSFEDDQGNSGTWSVEGNTLITVDEDGDEERIKYFVDCDDLTIIFSSELLLDAFREDDDFTDEEVAVLEEAFGLDEDTNFRLFFKRK